LTYISFILWTFCSKGDTRHATCRHAAHCELDALFDHGSHDITTCITLPSASLTQHPISDLTGDFQHNSGHSRRLHFSTSSEANPHESSITDHGPLISPPAISMRKRATRAWLDEATTSDDTCLQFFLDIVTSFLLGFFPPFTFTPPILSPDVLFENENPLNFENANCRNGA
jgi:hypothetical protein